MMQCPGRIIAYDEIQREILETSAIVESSTIRNHVGELRARLGEAGQLIRTLRGTGYVLEPQEAQRSDERG